MFRYTLAIIMVEGPSYHDAGLTKEELKAKIKEFFQDDNCATIHIRKYEV